MTQPPPGFLGHIDPRSAHVATYPLQTSHSALMVVRHVTTYSDQYGIWIASGLLVNGRYQLPADLVIRFDPARNERDVINIQEGR